MKLNYSLACLWYYLDLFTELQSCRVLTCTLKQTSVGVLWRNDVYAVEIVLFEVAWLSVKVKCAEHTRVLRNYFNFLLVKCKSHKDKNLFLG